MKFEILMPGTNRAPTYAPFAHGLGPTGFRRILEAADHLPFHSVLVSEHLAMPWREVPRLGPYWAEALSFMSFALGATRRIRVDTAVLVAPYHHPLRLAKALATMDVLSDGRVSVSVGVGHVREEFDAMGVPFTERGRMTDEVLEAIASLWALGNADFEGAYYGIAGMAVEPKPLQKPHLPVFVGGNSKAALRRAARYDGWQPNPLEVTPRQIPPLLDYIASQPGFEEKAGSYDVNWTKSPNGIELSNGFRTSSSAQLRSYRDALTEAYGTLFPAVGITRAAAEPPLGIQSLNEYLDYLHWFAEEVISQVP